MSLLFMNQDENVLAFRPYRQLFVGLDGYMFNSKLSYNIGFDIFDHIKEWGEGQNTGYSSNFYSNDYVYLDTLIENISDNINGYWISQLINVDQLLGYQQDYQGYYDFYFNYYQSSLNFLIHSCFLLFFLDLLILLMIFHYLPTNFYFQEFRSEQFLFPF